MEPASGIAPETPGTSETRRLAAWAASNLAHGAPPSSLASTRGLIPSLAAVVQRHALLLDQGPGASRERGVVDEGGAAAEACWATGHIARGANGAVGELLDSGLSESLIRVLRLERQRQQEVGVEAADSRSSSPNSGGSGKGLLAAAFGTLSALAHFADENQIARLCREGATAVFIDALFWPEPIGSAAAEEGAEEAAGGKDHESEETAHARNLSQALSALRTIVDVAVPSNPEFGALDPLAELQGCGEGGGVAAAVDALTRVRELEESDQHEVSVAAADLLEGFALALSRRSESPDEGGESGGSDEGGVAMEGGEGSEGEGSEGSGGMSGGVSGAAEGGGSMASGAAGRVGLIEVGAAGYMDELFGEAAAFEAEAEAAIALAATEGSNEASATVDEAAPTATGSTESNRDRFFVSVPNAAELPSEMFLEFSEELVTNALGAPGPPDHPESFTWPERGW